MSDKTEEAKGKGCTDPDLLARLTALMETRGWSQRKCADELGVSQSWLSQWMANSKEATEVRNKRVREWLEERRQAGDGLVASEGFQKIQEVCGECHKHNRLGVLIGPPGDGKTLGLEAYEREHDDVILILADATMTPKVLLEDLCGETGGTTAELMRHARVKTAGKLLLIDEADTLPIRSLEVVRRIYDWHRVGVVLAGEPRLERMLQRSPGTKDNLARFYSRVAYFVSICEPAPSDIISVLDKRGIDDPGARKLVITAGTKASFRAASHLLDRSIEMASLNNIPVNETVVRAAARRIILPVKL